MNLDIITSHYVKNYTVVPTPSFVKWDLSNSNPLGMPFMLQYHQSGENLKKVLSKLNFEQRMGLTKEVAKLILRLQSQKSTSCSILSSYTYAEESIMIFQKELLNRHVMGAEHEIDLSEARKQTTLQFIIDLCEHMKGQERHDSPDQHWIWDGFTSLAADMHSRGMIPDVDYFYFTHLALHPAHILVDRVDDKSVEIKCVFGWEHGLFAPQYMSCCPPTWL
ncbi:uncharacterized protein K460DRAFT_356590 [Cucurbitaria berberidis CBS 394.84]|uniref:Aminoglycoside phosphotransferase domain-containing protein n=1 Tax=Cucurbitaria berberidis CBS 394.84 TaxID=1168544 RepID=A0A9P4GBG9_9PLEO|nr:uncharacterized protein K460DRAFT_356590 [Cucurbitaria berberidis CBS 394.84]KAF1842773.1 hypothetical protein K460DRAFT_356590 [Cucurbitaria berberidis CBS 394.84]